MYIHIEYFNFVVCSLAGVLVVGAYSSLILLYRRVSKKTIASLCTLRSQSKALEKYQTLKYYSGSKKKWVEFSLQCKLIILYFRVNEYEQIFINYIIWYKIAATRSIFKTAIWVKVKYAIFVYLRSAGKVRTLWN